MKQASITDIAREYIEKAIFKREFHPGHQIKEEQIAEALEISRPPIREAFKLLEAEGLIVRRPRRGVFVAETTHQDVWEIYTLKAELYSFTIRLAFDRLIPDDITRMGEIVAEMKTCVTAKQPDVLGFQELNSLFHDIHVDAAGNRRVKQMLQTLHKQIRFYSFQNLSNKDYLLKNYRYHEDILEAFQRRDIEDVIKRSREHVLVGLKKLESATGDEPITAIA